MAFTWKSQPNATESNYKTKLHWGSTSDFWVLGHVHTKKYAPKSAAKSVPIVGILPQNYCGFYNLINLHQWFIADSVADLKCEQCKSALFLSVWKIRHVNISLNMFTYSSAKLSYKWMFFFFIYFWTLYFFLCGFFYTFPQKGLIVYETFTFRQWTQNCLYRTIGARTAVQVDSLP